MLRINDERTLNKFISSICASSHYYQLKLHGLAPSALLVSGNKCNNGLAPLKVPRGENWWQRGCLMTGMLTYHSINLSIIGKYTLSSTLVLSHGLRCVSVARIIATPSPGKRNTVNNACSAQIPAK